MRLVLTKSPSICEISAETRNYGFTDSNSLFITRIDERRKGGGRGDEENRTKFTYS